MSSYDLSRAVLKIFKFLLFVFQLQDLGNNVLLNAVKGLDFFMPNKSRWTTKIYVYIIYVDSYVYEFEKLIFNILI